MSLPKIVIFVDWFVPAYKAGGPISSIRNLCLALADDYEIYVITGDTDLGDTVPLPNIATGVWTELMGVNVIYLDINQQNTNRYQELLTEIKPEAVHLNSLFSKRFTLLTLKALKKSDAKIVISPRGMFGPASLKIKPFKKKIFFIYAKILGVFNNITWHATSDIEKKEIKAKFPNANVSIANNFPYLPEKKEIHLVKKVGELKLICVGRIARIKNIDFLLRVLQKVKANIQIRIVGPVEDEAYYQECKEFKALLPQNIQVEFIEGVNFIALNALYAESHVFISPTKNENFGHGIAEAFGHGCPVIISDATPWKGLRDKEVGENLDLEEDKFVDAIEKFAGLNESDFNSYRISARNFAENNISSGDLKKGYEIIYGN